MKHALSYHEYRGVCSLAEEKSEIYEKQYLSAIDSLFTNWTGILGHDKICVLGFILARTFKYGKAAAAIPFPAFLGGVTSERCATAITSSLKISKNTLRNILKELTEDGFLHVFFPEKRRGIVDTFTRYFEIDFKKLQKLRHVGSEIMSKLRTPKPKKQVENDEERPSVLRQPRVSRLPKLGDLSITNHEVDKSTTASPAARGTGREEPKTFAIKRILRSTPATTKPSTPAPTPAPDHAAIKQAIIARMDAMQAAAKARREEKAKSATGVRPAALQQSQMQALVDQTMAKYYPDLPRLVVTGKAFGAMKNHLKRSAPADIVDFINWTLRMWPQLAEQHAQGARKALADPSKPKSQPLPYAPNFGALGFRTPYFLACYNNRKAENARMGDRETRDSAAIKQAQRAAAQAQQETASLRALLRKQQEQRRTEERRTTRVDDTQPRGGYDDPEQDNETFPTWK